jgi:hypothetical protein
MLWPLSQDYNEAVQSPARNFADPDLRTGQAVTNALGIPMPCSGNFADVYQVRCPDGTRWAVKCFTRGAPGLRERYQQISSHLAWARLPFTVDFAYLEDGIRVAGKWYPVLKMQWVEGLTLNQFVRQYADKPAMLEALLRVWSRMAKLLRAAGTAHCDLQHGNVLLVPGATANSLALKLIDYDGMFVPALDGSPPGELGHPSYQHPQRLHEGTYSLEVDRFPLLVVATALTALKVGGRALWEKYDDGDNLLFRQPDFETTSKSPLFYELLNLDDFTVRFFTENLIEAARKPLDQTPLLEDLLAPNSPGPLPRAAERIAVQPAVTLRTAEPVFAEPAAIPSDLAKIAKRGRLLRVALVGATLLLCILGVGTGIFIGGSHEPTTNQGGNQASVKSKLATSRAPAPSAAAPPVGSGGAREPPSPDRKEDKTDTPAKVVPSAKMFPGLLAYWPFDEGEGGTPADVCEGGVRGKGHNIVWVDGVRGKAIRTKGRGSYFDFSAHPKLSFAAGADFSFCGWVRTRQKDGPVLSNRADADVTPDIDLHLGSGTLRLQVRQQGATDYIATLKGTKVVSDGAWHHFVFTRQGADMALYTDGAMEQRLDNTRSGGAIPTDLRALGAELCWLKEREGLDTDYLAGDFDEFCVFGRALSAAEIRTLAGKKAGGDTRTKGETRPDTKPGIAEWTFASWTASNPPPDCSAVTQGAQWNMNVSRGAKPPWNDPSYMYKVGETPIPGQNGVYTPDKAYPAGRGTVRGYAIQRNGMWYPSNSSTATRGTWQYELVRENFAIFTPSN